MNKNFEKLAKCLKTKPEIIEELILKMDSLTGKTDVLGKIIADIEAKKDKKLAELNLTNPKAEDIFNALVNRLVTHDERLFEYFKYPDFIKRIGYQIVLEGIKNIVGPMNGFYLKKEPALELFRKNPPRKMMYALGYGEIEKMLEQEDWLELFAGLRILEDQKWLNEVFFVPYKDFKPEDFEERDIQVLALPQKWADIAKRFEGIKLHHMSHLKELGLVFVIPIGVQGSSGELIYLFFMTLHYLHEVDWHAKLFKKYSQEKDFAQKIINVLKVEVSQIPLENQGGNVSWRIVPKYLAKNHPEDSRLLEPRINPEAWHYTMAAQDIKNFASQNQQIGLSFWDDLNYVAWPFLDQEGKEILVSFDMFDIGIFLLKKANIHSRYLYHQPEALWNQIFIEYMGEETIKNIMVENLDKGIITL